EQALMNLAVNGREAMAQGGTLTVQTRTMRVAETGRDLAPGDYVALVVGDTGRGMPPVVARRAWEPYFSTKPDREGSGLGLAVVYRVARDAGGAADLVSLEGEGTTVSMVIPAAATT